MILDIFDGVVTQEPYPIQGEEGVGIGVAIGDTNGEVYHHDPTEVEHLEEGDTVRVVTMPMQGGDVRWYLARFVGEESPEKATKTEKMLSASIARIYRRLVQEDGVSPEEAKNFASTVFINMQ